MVNIGPWHIWVDFNSLCMLWATFIMHSGRLIVIWKYLLPAGFPTRSLRPESGGWPAGKRESWAESPSLLGCSERPRCGICWSSPTPLLHDQNVEQRFYLFILEQRLVTEQTFYGQEYLRVRGCIHMLGCHGKVEWTKWLKQWKLSFSQFWRLPDQDESMGTVAFF